MTFIALICLLYHNFETNVHFSQDFNYFLIFLVYLFIRGIHITPSGEPENVFAPHTFYVYAGIRKICYNNARICLTPTVRDYVLRIAERKVHYVSDMGKDF